MVEVVLSTLPAADVAVVHVSLRFVCVYSAAAAVAVFKPLSNQARGHHARHTVRWTEAKLFAMYSDCTVA